MTKTFSTNKLYKEWVVELKSRIQGAQIKAAMTVNRQLLELYWELGREILRNRKYLSGGMG
jgi:hypothetical protein